MTKETKQLWSIWIIATVALIVLTCAMMALDASINPWLKNVGSDWRWYNYLTSSHGPTVLFLQGSRLWLLAPLFCSAVLAAYLFFKGKE